MQGVLGFHSGHERMKRCVSVNEGRLILSSVRVANGWFIWGRGRLSSKGSTNASPLFQWAVLNIGEPYVLSCLSHVSISPVTPCDLFTIIDDSWHLKRACKVYFELESEAVVFHVKIGGDIDDSEAYT